jgi:hypothetical protein
MNAHVVTHSNKSDAVLFDPSRQIMVSSARRTGKTRLGLSIALNATRSALILTASTAEMREIDALIQGSFDAVRQVSHPDHIGHEFTARQDHGSIRVDVMTWERMEKYTQRNRMRGLWWHTVVGMEPWLATSKQVALVTDDQQVFQKLVLVGTPKPTSNGVPHLATELWHSGAFSTHTIRMVDVEWHSHKMAAEMIATMPLIRSLCEVLAEVPTL